MSEGNGYVTREQWLSPLVRTYKDVHIEGLGKVRIQSLTEAERQRVEAPNYRTKKGGGIAPNWDKYYDQNCRFIVACVVDADGNQVLQNSDVDALRTKDSRIVSQLSLAIAEHCGLSIDMEALEKKSEQTHDAG